MPDRLSDGEETAERILGRLPPGTQADVRVDRSRYTTMRFANGWIHQPHMEEMTQLSLRIALGQRIGTVTSLDLSDTGIARAIESGLAIARAAPEEKAFPGFDNGGTVRPKTPYSRSTAQLEDEPLARYAQGLIDGARDELPDGRISGVVHQGDGVLTVANTRGRSATERHSVLAVRVLVEQLAMDPPASGWSEAASWDARTIRPAAIGKEAADRVARTPPVAMKPGRYRVLFDGSAAAKIVDELGTLGFTARGAEEGWSCLAKKEGKRIAPARITIEDDGLSPLGLPVGIDWEGNAKRRRPMVKAGVAQGPALDLLTAARMKRRSTAQSLPPEAPLGEYGAAPLQMIVAPGSGRSMEELIRETKRGILVTRMHYVRTVHATKGLITGMTRDGTFRIEKGEIVAPLRNLRFTDSILSALNGVELLGRERRCYAGDDERGMSAVTAPPMVVDGFRFTSATVF